LASGGARPRETHPAGRRILGVRGGGTGGGGGGGACDGAQNDPVNVAKSIRKRRAMDTMMRRTSNSYLSLCKRKENATEAKIWVF
jgi:hypothetical protein